MGPNPRGLYFSRDIEVTKARAPDTSLPPTHFSRMPGSLPLRGSPLRRDSATEKRNHDASRPTAPLGPAASAASRPLQPPQPVPASRPRARRSVASASMAAPPPPWPLRAFSPAVPGSSLAPSCSNTSRGFGGRKRRGSGSCGGGVRDVGEGEGGGDAGASPGALQRRPRRHVRRHSPSLAGVRVDPVIRRRRAGSQFSLILCDFVASPALVATD